MRGRYNKEIKQIESIAETKGIDLDDIVVNETETKDGDEMIVFRVLETKAETETDSVGVQVSKVPSIQTGDMAFRNEVQNKLNALKRHLSGEQPSEQLEQDENEQDQTDDASDTRLNTQSSRTRIGDGAGPGAELDQRLMDVEERLHDLEARVEELEEYIDALEGLQKIVGQTDDGEQE
jgi:hypothetical protein